MALPLVPLIAFFLVCSLAIYQWVIYPIFLSPLSKIPNAHWSAPISRLWILSYRRVEQDTPTVHAAHQRLGPIVRIAPNEVSVNSVDGGIRTIYSGGYQKGDWYQNIFCNYGVEPMFAMPDHGPHSKRKRMVSNIYAKSTLQTNPSMHAITDKVLNERFIPRLRNMARSQPQGVEFYYIFSAIATDFVSAYVFGLKNSSNYIQQPETGRSFFRDFKSRQRHAFWPQDLPWFTGFMNRVGLLSLIVPPWVAPANRAIEDWIMSMCDAAEKDVRGAEMEGEKGLIEDWPTVYSQLRSALLKDAGIKGQGLEVEHFVKDNRLAMASEMLDHTLAGFDTSSITLTFLAYELSLSEHKPWQEKLRAELGSLKGNWDAKEIDSLPILHAILMETLRLHAAIPGNQPRITPASATLGPPGHTISGLPANVRVHAQAWSLHRNPEVFPEPETWNPARWLDSSDEQLKEMQRWFWAFGSGGRMCVGSNLAMLDMKAIMAALWSEFETVCVDGEGMVHNGGYVAEPMGKDGNWCVLRMDERSVKA